MPSTNFEPELPEPDFLRTSPPSDPFIKFLPELCLPLSPILFDDGGDPFLICKSLIYYFEEREEKNVIKKIKKIKK